MSKNFFLMTIEWNDSKEKKVFANSLQVILSVDHLSLIRPSRIYA